MGTVVKIIYNEGESPLDGTLPQFAIMEFPQCCGPCWTKDQPEWVPTPIVQQSCEEKVAVR
jgi:hypothetical protein